MHTKRIIPCLDVNKGRVVKGVTFTDLKDAGDPVEIAKNYSLMGADEIIFLDITASSDKRETVFDLVKKVSAELFIPFCVGGGIRTVEDIRKALLSGADKVSFNTAAVENPDLIRLGAKKFGSQCIVLSVDAKRNPERKSWDVYVKGGRENTGMDAFKWAKMAEELGVGEILLNSIDNDGRKSGYDLELLEKMCSLVDVPVIASGGAGEMEDFYKAFQVGADAVLAASLFHFGEMTIEEVKKYLVSKKIPCRI